MSESVSVEIPADAPADELRAELERAFAFRGDVTVHRKAGDTVVGYLFDRRIDGDDLASCSVRVMLTDTGDKVEIGFADITRVEFTGKDCAAGKSFENWVNRYIDLKQRGLPASQ